MRKVLGFIRYGLGLVVYAMFALIAFIAWLSLIDVAVLIFQVNRHYECWEPASIVRFAFWVSVLALLLYWIARLLTMNTLEDLFYAVLAWVRRAFR